MDIEKNNKFYLKMGLCLFLFAVFLHSVWHFTIPTFAEMQGVTEIQMDLIKLLNLAIVLIFSIFTILAIKIIFSDLFKLEQIRFINLLFLGFFGIRFILEFLLPVKVPLLYTPYTSVIFKILLAIGIIVILIPEIKYQNQKNSKN